MKTKSALVIFVCLMFPRNLAAQDTEAEQFLFLDDWTYELVDYWVDGGQMQLRHALNQPYSLRAVKRGLPSDSPWTGLIRSYYRTAYGRPGFGSFSLYARDNLALVSDNLPVRKPLGAAPARELFFFDNKSRNYFNLAPQVSLLLPHATFVNRTMINSEYRKDPLYAGDNSESLYGRVNDAYLNLNFGGVGLFAGRMHRNWGTPGSPGLILSDNAYTFDHFAFTYTLKKFKFSLLVTRLEDELALFDEIPDSLLNARRYMTAHRIDFSPSSRLQFSLTEIAVYGGPGRDFEAAFLNPMNLFYLAQRNESEQVNGIWSLDLFYKPSPRLSFYMQFLLDDIILNNEPGRNDRAMSPDRLGIHLRLSAADWLAPGLQTGLEYTRIGNRTYQARRTWENFHYRGKSLGFPSSSTERVGVFAKYFRAFPTMLSLRAAYERTGNVGITDLFPIYTKEHFPLQPVERVWRLQVSGSRFLNSRTRLSATLIDEAFSNYNNIAGLNKNLLKASIGLHVRLGAEVGLTGK